MSESIRPSVRVIIGGIQITRAIEDRDSQRRTGEDWGMCILVCCTSLYKIHRDSTRYEFIHLKAFDRAQI